MVLDVVNQHVAKIILATEDGDSISRISMKIGASYGWTHTWVERLEEIGVIDRDNGVHIVDKAFAEQFEAVAKAVVQRGIEIEDAYVLPNFAGMPYAYTKTDAVFIWTKGGYQIGRSQNNYPIFIAVKDEDVAAWHEFFSDFGVETYVEERGGDGIYVVLFPQEAIEAEWVENAAVIPLDATVTWMQEYPANFQPALEMIAEMYDVDVDVTYRERETI